MLQLFAKDSVDSYFASSVAQARASEKYGMVNDDDGTSDDRSF